MLKIYIKNKRERERDLPPNTHTKTSRIGGCENVSVPDRSGSTLCPVAFGNKFA